MDLRKWSRGIACGVGTFGLIASLGLTGCNKEETDTGATSGTGSAPAVQNPGVPGAGSEGTTGAPRAPGR